VELSDDDLWRYSIKIESVGLRKFPHHHYFTKKVMPQLYIWWQWRIFFISVVFRHFVGQALRNVCYSCVSRRHFLNKIAIVRTFS